ncbi:MAG: hypothetical protein LQ340_007967 [Diploschistes diacapsis]|nr:MAG: hypothetical protein LQ340_007967 [Diploschistes diacapsis]
MEAQHEKEMLLDDNSSQGDTYDEQYSFRRRHSIARRTSIFLALMLCVSIAANLIVSWKYMHQKHHQDDHVSRYAKLSRNIPIPITFPEINHVDETADTVWQEIDASFGVIALEDEYSQSQGFPRGREFPWDSSRSIYLVNAFHNVHCLQNLRKDFWSWSRNETITEHIFEHALHCLESLR